MTHKHTYSIPSADDQNDARCIECGRLQPTTQLAKHTPGPWVVNTFIVNGQHKLEVLDATGANACIQANAHLIAAAPAMYAAMGDLISLFDMRLPNGLALNQVLPKEVWERVSTVVSMAKQVKAQAEGRER